MTSPKGFWSAGLSLWDCHHVTSPNLQSNPHGGTEVVEHEGPSVTHSSHTLNNYTNFDIVNPTNTKELYTNESHVHLLQMALSLFLYQAINMFIVGHLYMAVNGKWLTFVVRLREVMGGTAVSDTSTWMLALFRLAVVFPVLFSHQCLFGVFQPQKSLECQLRAVMRKILLILPYTIYTLFFNIM